MDGDYAVEKLLAMHRQIQAEVKWAEVVQKAASRIRFEASLRDPNDNTFIQDQLKIIDSFIEGHKYAAECVANNIQKKLAF